MQHPEKISLGNGVEKRRLHTHDPATIIPNRFYTAVEIADAVGVNDPTSFLKEHGVQQVRRLQKYWGQDIIDALQPGKNLRKHERANSHHHPDQAKERSHGRPQGHLATQPGRIGASRRTEGKSAFDSLVESDEEEI
jgi:hypothetical protein